MQSDDLYKTFMKGIICTPMPRVPRKAVSELYVQTEYKFLEGNLQDLKKIAWSLGGQTLTSGIIEVFKALSVQKTLVHRKGKTKYIVNVARQAFKFC